MKRDNDGAKARKNLLQMTQTGVKYVCKSEKEKKKTTATTKKSKRQWPIEIRIKMPVHTYVLHNKPPRHDLTTSDEHFVGRKKEIAKKVKMKNELSSIRRSDCQTETEN